MSPSVRRTDPARRTPAPVNQPKIGFVGWLRWAWRQLTSMRTALLLLLLLALGAVPGSLWPQRSLDASRTADYIDAHPRTGPWLDRLGFFDVYPFRFSYVADHFQYHAATAMLAQANQSQQGVMRLLQ